MRIFFDVDTQNDFMNKDGALYVPNAELIKPNLEKLTNYALKKVIPILGSMDWHYLTDKELRRNGGQFPDHCIIEIVEKEIRIDMGGFKWTEDKPTKGARKIKETQVKHNYIHDNEPGKELSYEYFDISNLKYKGKDDKIHYRIYYFTKHDFDVFTNRNTERVLKDISVTEAVVYGVATEYCIKAAALGLKKRGIEVYLVEDAIKPVKEEDGKKSA